jgi:hypothetical protein
VNVNAVDGSAGETSFDDVPEPRVEQFAAIGGFGYQPRAERGQCERRALRVMGAHCITVLTASGPKYCVSSGDGASPRKAPLLRR